MINKKGKESSADTEAMLYANDENQTFLEEINPGNQVKETLVFDIPKKSKPDKLLLKAGVLGFSEGVIVNVRADSAEPLSRSDTRALGRQGLGLSVRLPAP